MYDGSNVTTTTGKKLYISKDKSTQSITYMNNVYTDTYHIKNELGENVYLKDTDIPAVYAIDTNYYGDLPYVYNRSQSTSSNMPIFGNAEMGYAANTIKYYDSSGKLYNVNKEPLLFNNKQLFILDFDKMVEDVTVHMITNEDNIIPYDDNKGYIFAAGKTDTKMLTYTVYRVGVKPKDLYYTVNPYGLNNNSVVNVIELLELPKDGS